MELLETQEELEIEIEDLYGDNDENAIRELHELEVIRRLEMERAKDMIEEDRREKIRKQKNRWRVKSTRTKVIKRHSENINKFSAIAEEDRRLESLGTIELKKMRARKRNILKDVKRGLRNTREKKYEEINNQGYQNTDIRKMYDSIVAKSRAIVNDFTHGVRVEKPDIRSDRSAMCWDCGGIYCKCSQTKEKIKRKKIRRKKLNRIK